MVRLFDYKSNVPVGSSFSRAQNLDLSKCHFKRGVTLLDVRKSHSKSGWTFLELRKFHFKSGGTFLEFKNVPLEWKMWRHLRKWDVTCDVYMTCVDDDHYLCCLLYFRVMFQCLSFWTVSCLFDGYICLGLDIVYIAWLIKQTYDRSIEIVL